MSSDYARLKDTRLTEFFSDLHLRRQTRKVYDTNYKRNFFFRELQEKLVTMKKQIPANSSLGTVHSVDTLHSEDTTTTLITTTQNSSQYKLAIPYFCYTG